MLAKSFEDWTWQELVDYCAGYVLKQLLAGSFNAGIFHTMDLSCRWQKAQEEKEKRKKKKKK